MEEKVSYRKLLEPLPQQVKSLSLTESNDDELLRLSHTATIKQLKPVHTVSVPCCPSSGVYKGVKWRRHLVLTVTARQRNTFILQHPGHK